MTVAYWIMAALLAAFYLYAGGKKLTQSQEQLQPMMNWVDRTPMWLVRTIGGLEVLGAAGLILPPLTGIAPLLALVAALGFVVLQILATGVHITRGGEDGRPERRPDCRRWRHRVARDQLVTRPGLRPAGANGLSVGRSGAPGLSQTNLMSAVALSSCSFARGQWVP